MTDDAFRFDSAALHRAVELLGENLAQSGNPADWPPALPEAGIGDLEAMERLAPAIIGNASRLGDPLSAAHMDPPTPWITWATAMWNAALNQNLLHPATAPVARAAEARVIDWLAPYFGMSGGHMVPGSSVANLTALWAARECAGIEEIVHSDAAHLSVPKAAHILGLRTRSLPTGVDGQLRSDALPDDLSRAALVLTAGTTSTGEIDDLSLAGRAAWTHIDAAWAGPLRLSRRHAHLLDGIEQADSVAVSAHKWLFQPKESALILFRNAEGAHKALTYGGSYLTTPNIGVLGSHGAAAVPLLATLLAWGRSGLAQRLDRCMDLAKALHSMVDDNAGLAAFAVPRTGILLWKPVSGDADTFHAAMPEGSASLTTVAGTRWLRNVVANPSFDLGLAASNLTGLRRAP